MEILSLVILIIALYGVGLIGFGLFYAYIHGYYPGTEYFHIRMLVVLIQNNPHLLCNVEEVDLMKKHWRTSRDILLTIEHLESLDNLDKPITKERIAVIMHTMYRDSNPKVKCSNADVAISPDLIFNLIEFARENADYVASCIDLGNC